MADEHVRLGDVIGADPVRHAFPQPRFFHPQFARRAGKQVEQLRFSAYSLEQEMMARFSGRTLPTGIYGILGERFSRGKSNSEVAREMAAGGVDILQYREKLTDKSMREIYRECKEIRAITADYGIPFVVNDFAEIAIMVVATPMTAASRS